MERVGTTREPVLPAGLTTSVGGPAGRRLRRPARGPLASLAPVVLLLALPLSLAALRQAGCLDRGLGGRDPAVAAVRLAARAVRRERRPGPRARRPTSPAWSASTNRCCTGAVTSLLAGLAPGTGAGQQRWFLVLWMLLAAALLAGLVVAVGTVRRHPAADPVALALSPVLALTVLLSADLLPVALAVVAVWAWSRDRAGLAGVLAGLGVLGGAFSAVVLLAMVVVPGAGGRAARAAGSSLPRAARRWPSSSRCCSPTPAP